MTQEASGDEAARIAGTVRIVAALNLSYFAGEAVVALVTGSVSLFADSIDFLEDASISLLILAGLRWSTAARARLGMVLAAILLVPSLATLAMAWHRYGTGTPPGAVALGATGLGALLVNAVCAWLLARSRRRDSLMRAAFLSARNDAFANLAIIGAAFATARTVSLWPDLIVGLAIALLNGGAAWEVWAAARSEHHGIPDED